MVNEPLYSLRMRAAEGRAHEDGGLHISGGERLSTREELEEAVSALLRKALHHSRGTADFINIAIEKVAQEEIPVLAPLPISTYCTTSVQAGRKQAADLLRQSSVSDAAIERGFEILTSSYNLRGAVLLDSQSGERMDTRGTKGVRVSRMDWERMSHAIWKKRQPLLESVRVSEAVALATKVASAAGTVAELCWSDDPEYSTGYVSSPTKGYCRIFHLKEEGELSGGRIFFVTAETNIADYIEYLEKMPVWIG
ncbi:6-carboxyhexanoate--CoA ligase [Aneurinibacillus thermoaerophilus]|uniref:6-carboxyhexanoate--CoA ligase n=1 Tax=Aneurinibacillus thermoaerophilus TaxID=143495 RepID=A0A1G8ECW8_ANETH|nr:MULTISPECIES: 6-carboxyhexanoate--CoA ligase [Aneurinibacillus]AMA72395.1 hypothetical protein ACH33_05725 [Aneurinibacillus sp. XH2]MED0676342.1 6-carboxyhexanoate--CoA ligase [Aneurinibacillus thermoaerophilus]MED0759028.1 6-carboxyhexanoate--CoA ligase [Aneurinibacillus thermoaerophilus]MED0762683.1 6-carboxyhexanoate--CoA ligase [Aneurinibacillus thermoaerophilus]QYY41847.1 6-carboxyhexanoate--CoA ligase [Aneurinibacillus thermoaerophilus]